MQDNIPDALIAAFERHYDCSWDTPSLRNERLAWRAAWAEATKPCLLQITEPQAAPAAVAVPDLKDIPDWSELSERVDEGDELTPLEQFIHDYEASPGEDEWRKQLVEMVRHYAALAATPAAVDYPTEADPATETVVTLEAMEAWHSKPTLAAAPAADAKQAEFEAIRMFWAQHGSQKVLGMSTLADLHADVERTIRQHATAAAPQANAGAVIAAPVELLERVIDSLSSFAGNKPHTEVDMTVWEQLNDLLSAAPPAGWKLVPMEPTAEMLESAGATDRDGTPATYKTLYMAMVGAALNPPAAAPVVLPEPFALYDGERWYANEEAAICSCANMQKLQKVYIEQQVRALLAQAATAAAPVKLPQKVTEEMHAAAVKVLHRANGIDGLPQRMLDAMLAVAPAPADALATAAGLTVRDAVVQWWLATLDQYGNPTLTDGAHRDRAGADQAAYLIDSMNLGGGKKYAVARVELSEPKPSAEGVNQEAITQNNRAAIAAAKGE